MNNNQNNGWIRIHRQIEDNPLWFSEPFTKAQAWIDLVLFANHKKSLLNIRGNFVLIKRGQIGWSELTMAKRWHWSRNKVRAFLKMLENGTAISQHKSSVTTVITILNYEKFQPEGTTEGTTEGQQKVQQKVHKQECKEINKLDINISNDESKSRLVIIDYVLKSFYEMYGTTPTDKNPRHVAWSFIRNVSSFKQKSGNTKSIEDLLAAGIATFRRAFPDTTVTSLDTVRRHAKAAMDTRLLKIQKTQHDQQS